MENFFVALACINGPDNLTHLEEILTVVNDVPFSGEMFAMIEIREHRLPGPPENPCKEWGVYLDDVLLFTSKLSCDATLGKKQLENYIRKEIQAFALNLKSELKAAGDFGVFDHNDEKYPEYLAIQILKDLGKKYNLEGLI